LIIQGSKYLVALIMLLLFYFLVIRPIMKKLGDIRQSKTGELTAVGKEETKGSKIDINLEEGIKFPKTLEELEKR